MRLRRHFLATLEAIFRRQVAAIPAGGRGGERRRSHAQLRRTRCAFERAGEDIWLNAASWPSASFGVQMVRSADTIVALLGILKAGGVYLPARPVVSGGPSGVHRGGRGRPSGARVGDGCDGVAPPPTFSDPSSWPVIYTSGRGTTQRRSVSRRAGQPCHATRVTTRSGPGDRVLAGIAVVSTSRSNGCCHCWQGHRCWPVICARGR